MSKNTVSMLISMPLLSTMPMSKPMVKLMNSRLSSPAAVVNALEATGMKDWLSASRMACSRLSPASRNAL